jgi:nicotinate-nucleotide pyrophosphorylase (carboxylating)
MREIVKLALAEDRVGQDVTTLALEDFDRIVTAEVTAKAAGVMSGLDVFTETYMMVDPTVEVRKLKNDGDEVGHAEAVAEIRGAESSILKAERTALNFLQQLSGVATWTRQFVQKIKAYNVSLLDTRKTVPGMRYLQKKAVRDGGGSNHRLNLEDMAMVKDNHIRMAGTITRAVQLVRKRFPAKRVEVEVKNLEELAEALSLEVDMIMLDNFDLPLVKEAVRMTNRRAKLEVSGNVTLDNIEEKAKTGVDFISVGALTHSFSSLDFSLNIRIDSR